MNFEPQIVTIPLIRLVGLRHNMSFAANATPQLWQAFMPRRKEITGVQGTDLYSVQSYAPGFFNSFSSTAEFEKWAAVEVSNFENIPEGMKTLVLPAGLYAVFIYRGLPANASAFYQNIFGNWLPNSAYALDNRPHFEILGEKYSNNRPDSEEEVYIPVKPK